MNDSDRWCGSTLEELGEAASPSVAEPGEAAAGAQPSVWTLREAILLILVFLALFFLLAELLPYVWIGREVRACVGVAWLLVAATGVGLWFIERRPGPVPGRQMLQACGLGIGVCAYGMFLLAALGLWRDRWVWAFFLILQLFSLPQWPLLLRSLRLHWSQAHRERWSVAQVAGLILGGTVAVLSLLYAFLPPMIFDGLEYHLGVPWAYWQRGGMHFLPHLFYSNFPMNVEMVLTLAWRIAGEGGFKVLHWAFGLLSAAGVYIWLRRPLGRTGALLGALLFWMSGEALVLAVSAKIDLALTFFSLLAFESFWRWLHGGSRREALLCGVFCGLAVGSKYSAVGVVALPLGLGLLLSLAAGLRERKQWPILIYFGVAVGLLWMPWGVRNALYQGNPVFPLAYSVFGGKTMDEELHRFMKETTDATWPEELEQLRRLRPGPEQMEQAWGILTGRQVIPTLFLVLFVPLLLGGMERRLALASIVILLGWLVWVTLSRPLPRYLVPLYPAMAGLFLLALDKVRRRALVRIGWALLGVILAHHFLSFGDFIARLPNAPRFVSSRHSVSEGFLFGSLPHLEAIDFLNRNLSRTNAKVLFVAEARGYGCEVPYELNSVYDRAILLQIIGSESRPERWAGLLREAGYTHLLYNPIELHRYRRTFEASGWNEGERTREVMSRLEQTGGLRPLFATPPTPSGRITVYEIVAGG